MGGREGSKGGREGDETNEAQAYTPYWFTCTILSVWAVTGSEKSFCDFGKGQDLNKLMHTT